jgi:hypothetical protein
MADHMAPVSYVDALRWVLRLRDPIEPDVGQDHIATEESQQL